MLGVPAHPDGQLVRAGVRAVHRAERLDLAVQQRLVAPGDVDGYRQAILKFQNEPGLLDACEKRALSRASELNYRATAGRLVNVCREVLAA